MNIFAYEIVPTVNSGAPAKSGLQAGYKNSIDQSHTRPSPTSCTALGSACGLFPWQAVESKKQLDEASKQTDATINNKLCRILGTLPAIRPHILYHL
jgi:hypothetical protein